MIDSYIFGFLLSKINVNLFWTSGPIDAWSAPGVQTGTRALIKHGEITALEDSKATPQKVVYQPFVKK